MRVLVGPAELFDKDHNQLLPLPRGGHDVRTFGAEAPIAYQSGERWEELFGRFPDGWSPDVVVWWSPEYHPWPVLGECPAPLVAVVGDWNLNFSALREVLAQSDYIVTDRAGVQRLRALGYENVAHWPNFAFQPRQHFARSEPPLFDVIFIGNLNHAVQRRRASLLARLARFSDRYRVAILGGLYGPGYGEALARSRIVVNQSIRGEMNMRAYEAPACGALLFMERDNLEVRDYFRDGVECVLYDESDFEDLLERYLTDEPARARVAAAGHARVQTESYPHHFQMLLDRLSDLDWAALRRQRECWAGRPAAERHYHGGRWLCQTGRALHLARSELATAVALAPDEPEYANAAAVADALIALALQRTGRATEGETYLALAERTWRGLLARWPDDALGWANLGLAMAAFGREESGADALREALGLLLAAPDCSLPREGCRFTPSYDSFRVESERAVATHVAEPDEMRAALGALLRWECARRLGELALAHGMPQRARELFDAAITARPDLEAGHSGLGAALERLGERQAARAAYAAALERQPWDFAARHRLALLHYLAGDLDGCARVCGDGLLLARACPAYRDAARPLEGLLAQAAPVAVPGGGG